MRNAAPKKYTGRYRIPIRRRSPSSPTSSPYQNGPAGRCVRQVGSDGQGDAGVCQSRSSRLIPRTAGLYYYNEGAVLFTNTGKLDDAIAAFDKSIQIDPTRADAYYWKGVDLIGKATTGKDGKMVAPEGTADAFNKYLELQPTGKYADAAKQMLAMIGAPIQTTYGKQKPAKK